MIRSWARAVLVVAMPVGVLAAGAGVADAAAPLPCASPSATAGVVCAPEAFVGNALDGTVTVLNSRTGAVITTVGGFSDPQAVAVTPDGKTAYVVNNDSNSVTPLDATTNTPGTAIGVGSDPREVAVTPDGKTVYVTNFGDGTVTPIDVGTNTARTPITVGTGPRGVAVTPDGKTVYVANDGSNSVTPIDVTTSTPGPAIDVGDDATELAVTPDGKTVYVTGFDDGTVTPVDTSTNTAGTPITVGDSPFGLAVTPDGKTLYVANVGSSSVTPIDVATNTAGSAIAVTANPRKVAFTPDGKTAYVSTSGPPWSVTPVDVATHTAGAPIIAGSAPFGVAVAPTPQTAYVANFGSGTVTPVDVTTKTAGSTVQVGPDPSDVAVTPDGKTAYVADFGDATVTPIDLATNTAGAPITVGHSASGVAVTPDGKTVYVANSYDGTVMPIAVSTNTPGSPIAVGHDPEGIVVTPDGKTVYVANRQSNSVTPITVATNTAGAPISVLGSPQGVAVTPDGKTVYVANTGSNRLLPIDVATNTTGTPIVVSGAEKVAVTPDGTTAYVTQFGGGKVTPVDVATNTASTPITVGPTGGHMLGMAVTSDGKTAYASNSGSSSITPIDLATSTPGATIGVGGNPQGLTVGGPLQIGNGSALARGSVDWPYSQALWSVSGTAPFSYVVTRGSLPAGLSLSSAGVITGTPTTAQNASFTVAVYDSGGYRRVAAKAFTLAVTARASTSLAVSAPSSATGGVPIAASSLSATLSAGASPSGTVTFKVFGPSSTAPTDCSGGTTVGSPVSVSGNGTYSPSTGYTPAALGKYWWYASYNGDAGNTPAASACGASMAATVVAPASPSLSFSAPSSGLRGSAIGPGSLSAGLSGGVSPFGTVTFKVFGPQPDAPTDCSGGTVIGSAPASGNGTYNPSSGYTPAAAGNYWWYASYNGDSGNNPATSACGAGMTETVVAVPRTLTFSAPSSGTFDDQIDGSSLSAELTSGASPQGTVTFEVFGPQANAPADCSGGTTFSAANVTGNGTYHPDVGFHPTAAGNYWWYASYNGYGDDYPPMTSTCGAGMAETVVAPASPTVSFSSPSSTTPGVPIDASSLSAELTAGVSPSGTVTFKVFGPQSDAPTDCSGGTTVALPTNVSGDGTYNPSIGYTPATRGRYWWYARYSGDGNNDAATSGCGAGMAETVVRASPSLSASAPSSGTLDAAIGAGSLSAVLSGGASPSGTVTFKVFGPQLDAPTDCSGGTTVGSAVTVSGTGSYSPSDGYVPTAGGNYWWYASYSGDDDNSPVDSGCGADMAETVVPPSLTFSAPATRAAGSEISTSSLTAALSGAAYPTGTMRFKVFGPQSTAPTDCSSGGTDVGSETDVSYNGSHHPSSPYTPATPGDYWWYASYSGDADNAPAASACGPSMAKTVVGRASPTVGSFSVPDSSPVGEGLGSSSASVQLSNGASPSGSITFKVFGPQSTAPTDCSSGGTAIVAPEPVSGNAGYSPPDGWAPTETGTYWWYASYSGDDNNDPASSECDARMAKTLVEPATPSLFFDAPADGTVAGEIDASSLQGDLTDGVSPSGTVTFKVFGPQATAPTDCTSGGAAVGSTVAIAGNDSYSPTRGYRPAAPGDYWWYASYSGDGNNSPAASECGGGMPRTEVVPPGPVANLSVALAPASITADGQSTSAVTATVTDADGSPIAGDDVSFGAQGTGAPTIGAVTDNGDGTYTATVTASTTPGQFTITATDGGHAGSRTLSQTAIAPANVAAPSVSGTATDGETLTATTGTWTGSAPMSYGFQWVLCDGGAGNCADVPGQTASTYQLGAGDVGHVLEVRVVADNTSLLGGGTNSARSAPTGQVQGSAGGGGGGGGGAGSLPGSSHPPAGSDPTINLAALKASLVKCMSVRGKQAKIAAIVKHRGYKLTCTVPTAGSLTISWYQVPRGAHLAAAKKPVRIATVKKVLRKAGSAKLQIKVTRAGRALLRRSKRLKLTTKASFKAKGAATLSVRRPIKLVR